MAAATVGGLVAGRKLAERSEHLQEPFGILQGALIGFMGLVLAFGLSLAVGRYESRRGDVVAEANAIGTTYLRAQTLPEPVRTQSLDLLRSLTRTSIAIADTTPGTSAHDQAIADSGRTESRLWALAGQALDQRRWPLPRGSTPRR